MGGGHRTPAPRTCQPLRTWARELQCSGSCELLRNLLVLSVLSNSCEVIFHLSKGRGRAGLDGSDQSIIQDWQQKQVEEGTRVRSQGHARPRMLPLAVAVLRIKAKARNSLSLLSEGDGRQGSQAQRVTMETREGRHRSQCLLW